MDQEKIGRNITSLRRQAKLSQNQLADYMNITHQALSKWENGLALPDVYALNELSKLFKITLNELVNSSHPIIGELTSSNEIKEFIKSRKKHNRLKFLIIFYSLISLFLVIVLSVYFYLNNNTNAYYNIHYDDENLAIYNMSLDISRSKIKLTFDRIAFLVNGVLYNDELWISLYFKDDNGEYVFASFANVKTVHEFDMPDNYLLVNNNIKDNNVYIRLRYLYKGEWQNYDAHLNIESIKYDRNNNFTDYTDNELIESNCNLSFLNQYGYKVYDNNTYVKEFSVKNYSNIKVYISDIVFLTFTYRNKNYKIINDKVFYTDFDNKDNVISIDDKNSFLDKMFEIYNKESNLLLDCN